MRATLIFTALVCWLLSTSACAKRNELVMATTFSPEATAYLISRWQGQPQSVVIRTLNRTSTSWNNCSTAPAVTTSIWC